MAMAEVKERSADAVWPARVSRMARAVLERVRQMEAVVASGGGTVAAREQLRGARAVAREVVYAVCGLHYLPDDAAVMAMLSDLAGGQSRPCSTVGQMVSAADGDRLRSVRAVQPAWARGEADARLDPRMPELAEELTQTLAEGELTFDELHDRLGGDERCTGGTLRNLLGRLEMRGHVRRWKPRGQAARYGLRAAEAQG